MMGFKQVKASSRVHNPQRNRSRAGRGGGRKAAGAASGKKRQSNPGPLLIELSGLALNPHRGAKGMKKRTKKRRPQTKNPMRAFAPRRRRATNRRRNPSRSHRHTRRRNPNFASKGIGTLKNGFWALVGLVVTRQLPQMLLKEKNTGAMGYAANVAAAFAGGFLIGKFAGADAGGAALIGGGLYTVNRVISENFSPVGKFLSLQGMGDVNALGEILSGDRTYFPLPVAYDNNRNPIIPTQIAARPLPVAAATGPGMGAWGARRRVAA